MQRLLSLMYRFFVNIIVIMIRIVDTRINIFDVTIIFVEAIDESLYPRKNIWNIELIIKEY